MNLNKEGVFLHSISEDTVCGWKNMDMYLGSWQLVIGDLRSSFIFRFLLV